MISLAAIDTASDVKLRPLVDFWTQLWALSKVAGRELVWVLEL